MNVISKSSKEKVMSQYEERIIDTQAEIDHEVLPSLEQCRYELEIIKRLHDKAEDEEKRDDWRIQIDVQGMIFGMEESRLAELQADIERYEAIIAEIEADLEQELPAP